MKRLENRRILIIGASSGIGRAAAPLLAGEGARVALAARRTDLLEALAAGIPGGATAITCDVRDPESCESTVAQAVSALGGLDALVFATGRAQLIDIAQAGPEIWTEILETNLIGASMVMRAALPHLTRSHGRALFLSSISADDRPPRRGLGLYLISKAALNRMVDVWQEENHAVSFTRVSVGDTGATDMASDWDMTAGGPYVQEWIERGYMFGRAMVPDAVARHIVDLLAADEAIPVSTIVPRFAEQD
jgi:NAD(P)-dependent dehydrogenase (short-subunit alcohol dehydrogenase family)